MQPWTPGTPIASLPGGLPPYHLPNPDTIDLQHVPTLLTTYLTTLTPQHLTSYALWLDLLAKTTTIRTRADPNVIATTFSSTLTYTIQAQTARIVRLTSASWVSVPFTFTTHHGSLTALCSGTAFLTLEDHENDVPKDTWKIFSLTTVLESFQGHPSPDTAPPRPLLLSSSGSDHLRHLTAAFAAPKQDYQVIIIGAGQNGLSLAGRLQALGISYLVLEKETIGYRWVSRYDSVRQHTVRGLNNLPFGDTWAVETEEEDEEEEFLPGNKVTNGFQRWVRRWGINVQERCEVVSCVQQGEGWTIRVRRHGSEQTLRGKHVAFALGGGLSVARWPEVAIRDKKVFKGTMTHTVDFKNSKGWKGKAVVVGTGTAAHDIAQDMLDKGLDVTMVQRSKTAVYPIERYAGNHRSLVGLGLENEAMDRLALGLPIKIAGEMQRRSYDAYVESHKDFFEALDGAGFKTGLGDGVDRTPDEIVYNHFGGYYIDIGTSKHIISGDIRLVNGEIDRLTRDGLIVGGKEVEADHIVFATGQESDYRKDLAPILPIAKGLPPVWGLTQEGDPRGMMEQVAPGLWLVMGSAPHARWYSRFIALQIQEQMLRRDSKI